jgi:hypothetical protein
MAVRTKHGQVCRPIIAPIAVDVLEFEGNATGRGIFLAPAAAGATLPEKVDHIPANPRDRASLGRVLAFEEQFEPSTLLKRHLAFQRAIDRDWRLTIASAPVLADAARLLRIHDPIVAIHCANTMALASALPKYFAKNKQHEKRTRDGLHRPPCCRFRSRAARAARSPRGSSRSSA